MRPARLSDAAALLPLYAEALALHSQLHPDFFRRQSPTNRARINQRLERLRREPHRRLLVAEAATAALCGLIELAVYETPNQPELVARKRAQVEELVVAPAFRRCGCGEALLAAARQWALQQGAAQLLLTVWEGNWAAAQFYAAQGFKPISQVLGIPL